MLTLYRWISCWGWCERSGDRTCKTAGWWSDGVAKFVSVALPHSSQQTAERNPARILITHRRVLRAEFPLVGPVVVHANNVEVGWTASEFWSESARQHVPSFKDAGVVECVGVAKKV